ncbi:hypothetical protein [Desulfosporosinus sp. Sb-LF]|uniref:hypothetical protein n=1 Tax=Desulfosporosinus sp. Sb-LF TaxID=2560027 RepID=UPI00107F483D|nr:hypothetical protein [Desulfosporosinus sp. Sb-LF]TGE31748.1 hypothetical protein E4K68_15205 [Desulfosporosinus sp. Sb-LF]
MINKEIEIVASASKSEQLKDKYSQMEDSYSELKRQALLHETQGLVPIQQQAQPQQQGQGQGQGQTS